MFGLQGGESADSLTQKGLPKGAQKRWSFLTHYDQQLSPAPYDDQGIKLQAAFRPGQSNSEGGSRR
jgi:hypothetical protein